MSDDPAAMGDDQGRSGAAAILDTLEEHFVRRDEFDALRAEVEKLRRLVETTEPEEPQP